MKVLQYAETDIELSDITDPGFEVESRDPQARFSALPLFATALGLCTFSVLAAYAEHLHLHPEPIRIRVRWDYLEDPFRMGSIEMDVSWPGLPESRREAARRAAEQCTLHHTLAHPPKVVTRVGGT